MSGGAPRLIWLRADDPVDAFPPAADALAEPDGLLAAGGDLAEERLLYAYRHGIFPWYDKGQPILWWSPDPRCILRPAEYHLSRSAARALRRSDYTVTCNRAFAAVMDECAAPRASQPGTWITAEMKQAYRALHDSGWAHSVEVWQDRKLAGGIYGIASGKAFFGESMFSRQDNGSKAALLVLCRHLAAHDFGLLDCQVISPHLLTLGATSVPRKRFLRMLDELCVADTQLQLPVTDHCAIGEFL